MSWGQVIEGSVLDCNKKYLERALKDYDRNLYLKWNPKKNAGQGTWELRRLPNEKTAVPKYELNGQIVFELEYLENDLMHCIIDVPVLNYSLLKRLREMDTWGSGDWVADLEYREQKSKDLEYDKNKQDLKYNIMQYRKAFADFKEEVRSGRTPADFLRGEW